jgi:hypothetical protein
MGGNSLLAIQFINRVHQVLDVELPLDSFLSSVTIADLVPLIEQRHQSNRGTPLLGELEQLSNEEVEAILEARKMAATGNSKTLDQV